MKNEEKQNEKSHQTTSKTPPTIVAKPGGSESGTNLRMFEEYQDEKKRDLKK